MRTYQIHSERYPDHMTVRREVISIAMGIIVFVMEMASFAIQTRLVYMVNRLRFEWRIHVNRIKGGGQICFMAA